MDEPSNENAGQPTADEAQKRPSRLSPEERKAERIAQRKAAEADMSWDEIKESRRLRAAERQDRLAALPDDVRAEKEAKLLEAKRTRLADRTDP